ncbi:hypothetical protein [Kitasatospora sp. GP82]|uniref:hypothetical protein n=1 Tax=Kitasatospora sp. GP82 TaxID=3035089 RepID=UPI00247706EA|nr:hypothetical protein [Kitasatospora sp. GP82]
MGFVGRGEADGFGPLVEPEPGGAEAVAAGAEPDEVPLGRGRAVDLVAPGDGEVREATGSGVGAAVAGSVLG